MQWSLWLIVGLFAVQGAAWGAGGVAQADGLDDRPRDEFALTAARLAVSLAVAAVTAVTAALAIGMMCRCCRRTCTAVRSWPNWRG